LPIRTEQVAIAFKYGDVLTSFLDENGNAFGRPVGAALDKQGALLVADDVGNAIWRVPARR